MIEFKNKIFNISKQKQFKELAMQVFHYQAKNNSVYNKYLDYLNTAIHKITEISDIPFLPLDFFKTHKIITGNKEYQKIFYSSGTTNSNRSKHYINDLDVYETSFIKTFEYFYGKAENYCILALLPTYLENESSSLVYMTNYLIKKSENEHSGFYLNNTEDLVEKLKLLNNKNQPIILLGVSYALLNLAENYPMQLKNTIVMETGGMKGQRKELTRNELHNIFRKQFELQNIHSEYGMTELLSQAYSRGEGKFFTPPWMKILIRDSYDPFTYMPKGKSGAINIIDLANINSCSFLETKDLGKIYPDNSFEVLGRFDNSDIRGCNLLVANS
ncbi:MAG: acyltransferase [Bacteroidales bacterium]|jgi:hypothetical protein|nr:acyltransferase [Bacteroidales bacterium]